MLAAWQSGRQPELSSNIFFRSAAALQLLNIKCTPLHKKQDYNIDNNQKVTYLIVFQEECCWVVVASQL